ncbi:MAG: NusG domain II-containing protein [Candidatus Howiella sp.]|jgi:hypothetical protein
MSTLKTRIKIKKADLLLLGGILLFCAVGLLLYRRTGTPGRTVRVEADGRLYGRWSLSEDAEIDIGGHNLLRIEGGEVVMQSADCPDGLCVAQPPISAAGQSIVCLPNRVVATVEGKPETDAVAG